MAVLLLFIWKEVLDFQKTHTLNGIEPRTSCIYWYHKYFSFINKAPSIFKLIDYNEVCYRFFMI